MSRRNVVMGVVGAAVFLVAGSAAQAALSLTVDVSAKVVSADDAVAVNLAPASKLRERLGTTVAWLGDPGKMSGTGMGQGMMGTGNAAQPVTSGGDAEQQPATQATPENPAQTPAGKHDTMHGTMHGDNPMGRAATGADGQHKGMMGGQQSGTTIGADGQHKGMMGGQQGSTIGAAATHDQMHNECGMHDRMHETGLGSGSMMSGAQGTSTMGRGAMTTGDRQKMHEQMQGTGVSGMMGGNQTCDPMMNGQQGNWMMGGQQGTTNGQQGGWMMGDGQQGGMMNGSKSGGMMNDGGMMGNGGMMGK